MIVIKKTSDVKSALLIAEKLHGTYFNDQGIKEMTDTLKKREFYGAFEGERMLGFIAFKEVNPEVIEITWIAVDPDNHNQGIGTELLNKGLQMLGKDYKICEVKTLSEEEPDEGYRKTRKFYQKLGFIPLETINSYPGWEKNSPCQILIKPLE